MRKLMRKRILLPVVAIAAIAVAGVAYAFFTTSGTGSGTATVGTTAGLTIDPVTITGTLYPGGDATVDFTINNSSSNTAIKVGDVVADTPAITGLPDGCSASDFTFADVPVGQTIAASSSVNGQGTLHMENTSSNQDACKGASPVLHLTVDNSGL